MPTARGGFLDSYSLHMTYNREINNQMIVEQLT